MGKKQPIDDIDVISDDLAIDSGFDFTSSRPADVLRSRFQTNYERDYADRFYEHSDKPSETKPSKSLSLREVIDRDLNGLVTPSHNAEPYYNENLFVPDFKRMDLAEMDAYKRYLESQKVEIENNIKAEKREKRAKEIERERLEEAKRIENGQKREAKSVDPAK